MSLSNFILVESSVTPIDGFTELSIPIVTKSNSVAGNTVINLNNPS